MNPRKLDHYKKLLLDEKKEVLETLERMENHHGTHASIREYTEELSAYDNHPADLGTEMFLVGMQANLENHHRYRITEIDRALQKIEEGSYGECDTCGVEIPFERLEIIPEANICMECAEEKLPLEAMLNDDRARPVEEQVLFPDFERHNMDGKDYTGFDGEDAYQAVAKYNEVKNDPSYTGGDHLGVFDIHPEGTVEEVDEITVEEYVAQLYTDEVDRKLSSTARIKKKDL